MTTTTRRRAATLAAATAIATLGFGYTADSAGACGDGVARPECPATTTTTTAAPTTTTTFDGIVCYTPAGERYTIQDPLKTGNYRTCPPAVTTTTARPAPTLPTPPPPAAVPAPTTLPNTGAPTYALGAAAAAAIAVGATLVRAARRRP